MELSPAFTPVHSFIGGLMLAVGVHFMLSQLGIVLGISGFFHKSVSCLVSSEQTEAANGNSIHHAISPEDDAERQSDRTYIAVSTYFITGMLAGGAGLAATQVPLESALGVKLFDSRAALNFHLGKGLSQGLFSPKAALVFLPSALWGLAVGFGTKLGSGCTSGHFICGLSRLSPRSVVATAVFFSVAVATHLLSHVPTKPLAEKPQTPSLWAILLLQVPAIFYVFVVPAVIKARSGAKGLTEEQRKSVQDQGARATAFGIGLHFALGLALTGMTRPSKVLGFFNLSPYRMKNGQWDPSLGFVALSAIPVSAVGYFFSVKPRIEATRTKESNMQTRRQRKETIQYNGPLYQLVAPQWRVPRRTDITWQLVAGAIFFGIGWGMTGLCPGPALTAFGASTLPSPQDDEALIHLAENGIFVGAMALGGLIASAL